jgi:hypothetical protein
LDFPEDAGNRENTKREKKPGQSKELELFNHGNFNELVKSITDG